MEIHPLHHYPKESLESILSSVHFYNAIKQKTPWQYDLLMRYSRIVEYSPGETLLKKGESDNWLYFLIKGQLAVTVGDGADEQVVNYITPGEVFGDLAMLVDAKSRTATVVADSNCKRVLAFGTDFRIFGHLNDTRQVSLSTKLEYYRNTVHNLRWKLESYRMAYPDKPFASEHRKIKLYVGARDSMEELESLYEQARALAMLITTWNNSFSIESQSSQVTKPSIAAVG